MVILKQLVTSANWDSGRGGKAVTGIVLHTMVGSTAGAYARFNNPSSQVSVHYGISLDGSVHQWVEENNTAWQAGNYAVNQATIGIEHEDGGNYNDGVRTPALYDASSDLVADICRRYNIPCDTNHIFRHHDVIDTSRYPGGTSCPDGLDTNKIIALAAAKLRGGDEMVEDIEHLNALYRAFRLREASASEAAQFVGKISYKDLIAALDNPADPERKNAENVTQIGETAVQDDWAKQIKDLQASNQALQAKLDAIAGPDKLIITNKGWTALWTAIRSFFQKNN